MNIITFASYLESSKLIDLQTQYVNKVSGKKLNLTIINKIYKPNHHTGLEQMLMNTYSPLGDTVDQHWDHQQLPLDSFPEHRHEECQDYSHLTEEDPYCLCLVQSSTLYHPFHTSFSCMSSSLKSKKEKNISLITPGIQNIKEVREENQFWSKKPSFEKFFL